jgi:hypothetical protein
MPINPILNSVSKIVSSSRRTFISSETCPTLAGFVALKNPFARFITCEEYLGREIFFVH